MENNEKKERRIMKYYLEVIETLDNPFRFEEETTEFINKLVKKKVKREDIKIKYEINEMPHGTIYYAIISWWK